MLSRSGLTRVVDRLVAKGFLKREVSSDGRGAYAVLTSQGFDELKKTWPVYRQGIIDAFGQHVSREEAALMTNLMQRICQASESQSHRSR